MGPLRNRQRSNRRHFSEGHGRPKAQPVTARARDLSEVAPEGMWWLQPRSMTSLRFVDNALQRIAEAADGADAALTPDARAGWAAIKPVADAALRAWNEFKAQNAAAFK